MKPGRRNLQRPFGKILSHDVSHVWLMRRRTGDKIQRRREAAAQQADINFPVDEPLLDIHAAAVADGKLYVRIELAEALHAARQDAAGDAGIRANAQDALARGGMIRKGALKRTAAL